jgi:hypothetical protein
MKFEDMCLSDDKCKKPNIDDCLSCDDFDLKNYCDMVKKVSESCDDCENYKKCYDYKNKEEFIEHMESIMFPNGMDDGFYPSEEYEEDL